MVNKIRDREMRAIAGCNSICRAIARHASNVTAVLGSQRAVIYARRATVSSARLKRAKL
jgi:hypothetical protein